MQEKKQVTKKVKYPEADELVLGTVSKVFPYGAFVKLTEYPGLDGMIHISEISSKWIKNIKDYVKEGETVVVKVLKIDREKGHIDLSLKSVKAMQKKQKTEEYKGKTKAKRLVEIAGKKLKEENNVDTVLEKIEDKYEDYYSGLEESLRSGKDAFSGMGLSDKWIDMLVKIVKENMELSKVTIKTVLELKSNEPNGVEIIRDALVEAEKKYNKDDIVVKLKYIGAPRYKLEITGPDYKQAEKCLDSLSGEVIDKVKKGGEGKLIRE